MARETNDGEYDVGFVVGDDELDPYPTGKPRYSGNFCVSTDDEGVPDGKIIGLQVGSTRWVNPNQCAQKALEAEHEQLASTHPRPEGDSGGPCGKPPCEHPGNGRGPGDGKRGNDRGRGNDDDDDDSDDAADDAGEIEATWEDCETVTVTGSDENLEGITVYYLLCFEPDGPCPDGTQGSVDDPELPLTIEDQYLTTEDVPYTIAVLEFHGDVEPDHVERPDDLDCSFE